MSLDAIHVQYIDNEKVKLVFDNSIADLQISVFLENNKEIQLGQIQLNKNQIREVVFSGFEIN